MKFRELFDRTPEQIRELTEVWGRSVRATHGFLTEAEIRRIREYVPHALAEVPHLVAAEEKGRYLGFLGVSEGMLQMLFLAPEEREKGIGRQLLELGIRKYGVRELTVNEQNPKAVGFYAHMGFVPYKRTETDEEGGPYPLFYMRLKEKAASEG